MTSVLVVDDDDLFRAAMLRLMNGRGYEVAAAASVAEALEQLTARRFHVVLTDLRMPVQDGIDLLEQLPRVAPGARPILMSAFATTRDQHSALALGALSVLIKPFAPEELFKAVEQAADSRAGFRGLVHGLSLVDVLQMFHLARRSLEISVSGATTGRIRMREGEIVHAEAPPVDAGEPALRALLTTPGGSLQTTPPSDAVAPTIVRPFAELLMDSLRLIDEQRLGDDPQQDGQVRTDPSDTTGSHPAPAPVTTRRHAMANVKETLDKAMEIDGSLGACLVDSNSGMMLGSVGGGRLNLEVAAAGNTEVVRAKRKVMKALGLGQAIEDILITLEKQYHIIRPLRDHDPLFFYVVLDKDKANLAMARHQLAALEKTVEVA